MVTYFGLLTFILLLAGVASWYSGKLFPAFGKIIGVQPLGWLLAVLVFVVGHLLLEIFSGRHPRMVQLWPFRQVIRFRKWLWTLVVLGFALGVVGNLYANQIQKQIDLELSAPTSSEGGSLSVPAAGSGKTPG